MSGSAPTNNSHNMFGVIPVIIMIVNMKTNIESSGLSFCFAIIQQKWTS